MRKFIKNKSQKKRKVVTLSQQTKISDLGFGTTISGTAAIASLSAVAQGVDVINRTGAKIFPISYMNNITVTASTTLLGTTVANVRLIVLQDLQQVQATAPTISDVINPANVVGQRNIYFINRFRILRDYKVKVDTYNPTIHIKDVIKLNGNICYASGAAADVSQNGIYFVYVSDNSVNPPTLVFNGRLLFKNS